MATLGAPSYCWESCFEQCKEYFCPTRETSCVFMCNETWSENSLVMAYTLLVSDSPEILRQALCVIRRSKHKGALLTK